MFMNISAFACFFMSVVWIQFTCSEVMDLLNLFGFITELPTALLALTLIAWGNSLGDMSADCAMTKRGFGEMAVTACVAGPVFNFLCGIGFAMTISILRTGNNVTFGFYDDGQFNKVAVLPFTLLCGQFGVIFLLLVNVFANKFHINFKFNLINATVYLTVIISLVVYSIVDDV